MSLEREIFFDFEREDGSQEALTIGDLGICYTVNEDIVKDTIAIVLRTFSSPVSSSSSDASQCGEMWKVLRVLYAFSHELAAGDLLLPRSLVDGHWLDVCSSYEKMLKARHTDECPKLWNRLPVLE